MEKIKYDRLLVAGGQKDIKDISTKVRIVDGVLSPAPIGMFFPEHHAASVRIPVQRNA